MTQTDWRPVRLQAARRSWPGILNHATEARHWLRDSLATDEDHDLVVIAEHVVAELVANALRHTYSGQPGGRFTVQYKIGLTGVEIGVTDEGPLPEVAAPVVDPLAEGGRGLFMVEQLGVRHSRHRLQSGQITWAVIAR